MRCFQIIGLLSVIVGTLQAQKHIPSPLEILTFIEASPLKYEFEQWYGQFESSKKMYIPFGSQINYPASGFTPILFDSILTLGKKEREWAQESLQSENPSFQQIQQIYSHQINQYPSYSFLKTLMGSSLVIEKKYSEAVTYLKEAIDSNYYDALAHWQLGICHIALQQNQDGLTHLITAHLLNRNHKGIKSALTKQLRDIQKNYDNSWRYDPVCEIRNHSDTIIIRSNGMWLSYGMYKAVWLYEPDYDYIRQSMTPIDGLLQSELEACIGTYMTYINMKEDDKRQQICMDKVGFCIEQEILESFILYEKILVDQPAFIFLLRKDVIDQLIQYVSTVRIH